MRKHFLLLFLMALLPLAGWAADLNVNGTLTALSPYYGKPIPAVKVTFGSTLLTLNSDYTFDGYFTSDQCTPATKIEAAAILAAPAGRTYYAKVTGINGYEGSLIESFQVKKMPLLLTGSQDATAKQKTFGEADPANIATELYSVTTVKENISGGATLTTTFTDKITFARVGGEDAKAYDIIATITDEALAENYTILSKDITTDGTTQAVFTINRKSVSGFTVDALAAVTYKGSAYTPALNVKDGTTVLVVDNTTAHAKDYYVEYSANVHVGTAHATINGTNNYTGTKDVTFTINQAPVLVTPSATKEYDGTNGLSTVTYIYQGFVDATTADNVNTTGAAATAAGLPTKAEEAGKPGEYVLTINDGSTFTTTPADYSFSFEPGVFKINRRKINVTVDDKLDQLYGATENFVASAVAAVSGTLPTAPKLNDGNATHEKLLLLALKGKKQAKAADNPDTSYDFDLVPDFRNNTEIAAAVAAAGFTSATTPKAADVEKYAKALVNNYEIALATSTNGKLKYTNAALTIALNESFFKDFYKDTKLQKVYDGEEIPISLDGVDKTKAVKVIGKKNEDVINLDNLVLTVEDNSANVKRDGTDPTIILPYRLVLSGAVAEHYNITYIPSSFYIQPRPVGLSYGKQAFRQNTVPSVAQNYNFETVLDGDDNPVEIQGIVKTDKATDAFVLALDNTVISVETADADHLGEITAALGTNYANAIIPVDPETEGSVFANYDFVVTPGSGFVDILANATRSLNENLDLTTLTASTGDETVILESDRQIKKNVWASLVLPFNTTVRKVSEALGYAVVDMFVEDLNSAAMNFKLHMGEIPAYTPFLVKTDETINLNTVKFAGVRVLALSDANRGNLTQSNKSYNFVGNMKYAEVGQDWWSDGTSMTEEGIQFNKYRGTKACVALKAYITAKGDVTAAPMIYIEEPDGSTTAINAITAEKVNAVKEGWYTLNGVKLQAAPTQKGIYINNGMKVVIK